MLPTPGASIRLLRAAGIDVYLHWLWLPFAYLIIFMRADLYDSQLWNVAEYVVLFLIVLLHEFGHSLACLSVGGKAEYIVLWPLGGVAYVQPPMKPEAVLWSIAAGPLVNLALIPVTLTFLYAGVLLGCKEAAPDVYKFLVMIVWMNLLQLAFNLLPIYPLDGGQMLQALLWFLMGRAHSLLVVSMMGLAVGVLALLVTLVAGSFWGALLAFFVAMRSLVGFQHSRFLLHLLSGPRHQEFHCPSCGEQPVAGEFWVCEHCEHRFDTFLNRAVCPNCNAAFRTTMCPFCFERHSIQEWHLGAAGASQLTGQQLPPLPPS